MENKLDTAIDTYKLHKFEVDKIVEVFELNHMTLRRALKRRGLDLPEMSAGLAKEINEYFRNDKNSIDCSRAERLFLVGEGEAALAISNLASFVSLIEKEKGISDKVSPITRDRGYHAGLEPDEVSQINYLLGRGMTANEVAEMFNVSPSRISQVRIKKSRILKKRPKYLTEKQKSQLKAERLAGANIEYLMKKWGVSRALVFKICKGD